MIILFCSLSHCSHLSLFHIRQTDHLLRRPNWKCADVPCRQRSPTVVIRSCRWGEVSLRHRFRHCRRASSTGTICKWTATDHWLPRRHRSWFPSTVAPCTRATVAFWVAALHSFLVRRGDGGNPLTMPRVAFLLDRLLLPLLHPAESITTTTVRNATAP